MARFARACCNLFTAHLRPIPVVRLERTSSSSRSKDDAKQTSYAAKHQGPSVIHLHAYLYTGGSVYGLLHGHALVRRRPAKSNFERSLLRQKPCGNGSQPERLQAPGVNRRCSGAVRHTDIPGLVCAAIFQSKTFERTARITRSAKPRPPIDKQDGDSWASSK